MEWQPGNSTRGQGSVVRAERPAGWENGWKQTGWGQAAGQGPEKSRVSSE